MEEVRIIKSIKYHIVNRYKIGEIWYKRDLCAYIATILYPFFDNIQYESDAKCLKRMGGSIEVISKKLNKKLKSLRKKHSELLKSYSFNGLVEFFKSKLDDSILTDKDINDAISLVDKIDESGCVSLKVADRFFDIIMNSYKDCEYLCKYGTFEYVNDDEENDNNQTDNFIEAEIEETSNTPYNKNLESTQLEVGKNVQSKKTISILSNIEGETEKEEIEGKFEVGYVVEEKCRKKCNTREENIELQRVEEELKKLWSTKIYGDDFNSKMPYVWKLRISYKIYLELKKKLASVINLINKNDKKINNFVKNNSQLLFVYIAEWFKWEYATDRDTNALIEIGLKSTLSKKIWDSLVVWQNFRYEKSNDIHLYSIYALGGFPLSAIFKNDKIDNLFECLLNENEDVDAIVKSLFKSISGLSNAFEQSLEDPDGSWREFIQVMNDCPESLYDDDDKQNNEHVRFFYERLENGRRASVEKLIKSDWIFYTSPDSEDITADIVIKIGKDGSDGCITTEIVKSDEEQIYIGIKCQDEIINYRKYSKSSDGKLFVGWGTISNRIRGHIEDFNQPINLCKYSINKLQQAEGEKITTILLGNKFIELYAMDDGSGWTTLREFKNNEKKAVLFLSDLYSINIKDNISSVQSKVCRDGKIWCLCEIIEHVQLVEKETGKIYNLYQEGEVSVKITSKTDIIKYQDNAKLLIKCFINGQEEYLPLMMGIPTGKSIKIYPSKSREDNFSLKFKDTNVKAEYTQDRQRGTLSDTDTFGVISLDLNVKNKGVLYSYKNKYFFVPANCIRRDVCNNKVVFDNLSGRKVCRVLSDDTEIQLDVNYYEDDSSMYQIEDTIKFRIYVTEKDYVEVDVYRPILYRELSLNGNIIKRYNDSTQCEQKISLPYILRKEFNLRVFNNNGVGYINDFKNIRWFPLDRPQNAVQQCEEFSIYLYANRQIRNEKIGVLDIGSKGVEQYKFYYWKVDEETQPRLIETLYDQEKQHLVIPTECLKNGGMIFQSLNGCTPRHYVTPIYAETRWRLLINPPYQDSLIYKCYKIAVAHKIPFTQFYPLHKAVNSVKNLRTLYDNVMSDRNLSEKDRCIELHRFANEFCFEWILLPYSFWKKIDKQQIIKLLQYSNFIYNSMDKQLLGRFLNIYLDGNLHNNIQIRKQNIANIFKYMRGTQNDPQIIPISDRNVEIIKSLYDTNEWIFDLLEKFENKKNI